MVNGAVHQMILSPDSIQYVCDAPLRLKCPVGWYIKDTSSPSPLGIGAYDWDRAKEIIPRPSSLPREGNICASPGILPPPALGTDRLTVVRALSSESGHDDGKYDHRLKKVVLGEG